MKIRVVWTYTACDYVDIEVDEKDVEKAKKKALAIAEGPESHELDWQDGEIQDGEYTAELPDD